MKRICAKCNKDLEKEMVYHIVDDQYICCRCYDFYHRPKYNELDFDNLRKVFRNEENQKTIECLKELERDIREIIDSRYVGVGGSQATLYVDYLATLGLIDNKIKELEGK